LDVPRAGRRSRVPARGDAGEEYLDADRGVVSPEPYPERNGLSCFR
jgi:hypothetical protein